MTRTLASVALAACLGLALGACGDDDGTVAAEDPPAAGAAVTVVAKDIRFPEHSFRATAGEVDISYRNEGDIPHTLVIQGVDGFKLEVDAHGDVDKASVDLRPGDYTIYCDIPGHRQAGMEGTLKVR